MGYKFSFCAGCETPRDCDACHHLAQLERAEREGRLKILPEPKEGTCGACGHFERIRSTSSGLCRNRSTGRGRTPTGFPFTAFQARQACANYVPRKEDNHGKADV